MAKTSNKQKPSIAVRLLSHIDQLINESKKIDVRLRQLSDDKFQKVISTDIRNHIEESSNENMNILDYLIKLRSNVHLTISGEKPLGIVVAGSFSSGKSTFLNGWLGTDLLVVDDGPTTTKLTRISYGPVERYWLVYSNDGIKADEKKELSIKQLNQSLQALNSDENHENKASWIDIELPVDKLKGKIFIDTPGLEAVGKQGGDTEGTLRAIREWAQVLIWIATGEKGGITDTDKKSIESFTAALSHPFVVINKLDAQAPGERKTIINKVKEDLRSINQGLDECVYPYSAKKVVESLPAEVRVKMKVDKIVEELKTAILRGIKEDKLIDNNTIFLGIQSPSFSELTYDDKKIPNSVEETWINYYNNLENDIIDIEKDRSVTLFNYGLGVQKSSRLMEKLEYNIRSIYKDIENAIKIECNDQINYVESTSKSLRRLFQAKNRELVGIISRSIVKKYVHEEINEGFCGGWKSRTIKVDYGNTLYETIDIPYVKYVEDIKNKVDALYAKVRPKDIMQFVLADLERIMSIYQIAIVAYVPDTVAIAVLKNAKSWDVSIDKAITMLDSGYFEVKCEYDSDPRKNIKEAINSKMTELNMSFIVDIIKEIKDYTNRMYDKLTSDLKVDVTSIKAVAEKAVKEPKKKSTASAKKTKKPKKKAVVEKAVKKPKKKKS